MVTTTTEDYALIEQWARTAATLVPLRAMRSRFLTHLLADAEVQTAFPGQVIFDSSSAGNTHFYLLHGRGELRYADGRTDIISGGNTAFPLVYHLPRPCSAVAKTDCSLLAINSDQLDRILSWSQVAEYLLSKIAAERDFDEDMSWMQTVLNSNLFFKVPPINVEKIFARLEPMVVFKDEVIIRQGEIGDCCYFIKEGTARVTRRTGSGEPSREGKLEHLADIGMGRCFGEDALVYDTVRNATVTMASDGVLMRLEKADFLLLLREPAVKQVAPDEMRSGMNPVLIDVRTEEEYAAGHLEQAANIPLHLLCLKKRLLTADRSYVFYCDTGRRSRAAAYLLGLEGYTTAALQGGLRGSGSVKDLSSRRDYILRQGEAITAA